MLRWARGGAWVVALFAIAGCAWASSDETSQQNEPCVLNRSNEPIEFLFYPIAGPNRHPLKGNEWENAKDTIVSIMTAKNYDFYSTQKIIDHEDEEKSSLKLLVKCLPDYGLLHGNYAKNVAEIELMPPSDPRYGYKIIATESIALFYRKDRWELDTEEYGNIWYEVSETSIFTRPQVFTWGLFHEKTIEGKRTGKSLYVYSSYFWPGRDKLPNREEKIVDILNRIASRKYPNVPVIIACDFNSRWDDPLMRFLRGQEVEINGEQRKCPVPLMHTLRAVYPDATDFRSMNNGTLEKSTIEGLGPDHIFVSSGLTPLDFRLDRTQTPSGFFPSYHYPHHATLSWEGEPADTSY